MTATIEAHGLAKRLPARRARSTGSTWSPSRARSTAVLGPNGAGKTTFVRAVATLLRPDAGTLRVAGTTSRREPERGPPADRPGRPVRRRRAGDDRAREPRDGRPALRPGPARRRGRARQQVLEQLGLAERGRPPGADVLGRHAPPARPRRQPGRRARGCCCSTSRPPASTRAAGSSCGTRSAALVDGGHRRAAHHPVPRRGRPARRARS